MSTVSHPSFPLHFLIGNPHLEQLELRDINAADLTPGDDDGPCPICDAPTEYSPEDEAEMERLFFQAQAADDDSDPDDDPPPAGAAMDFGGMHDDELIAVCADETADEALLCGASLELLRRLDARPAHRIAA
jgi:hypothetical protein